MILKIQLKDIGYVFRTHTINPNTKNIVLKLFNKSTFKLVVYYTIINK